MQNEDRFFLKLEEEMRATNARTPKTERDMAALTTALGFKTPP